METMVEIVLEDGPDAVPQSFTTPLTPHLDRIKVPHLNGYEHYELDPATAASSPMRFRWTMRTKIAE